VFATSEKDSREFLYGPCFGLGFHANVGTVEFTFDYSYRSVKYFDGNNVFSVMVGM
jgi:hypothetical protein